MKSLSYSLVLLTALLASSSSDGAEFVLRERATQNGTVIRLGDIADISTASSSELKRLASTPLLPAPAPGTQQFLNVSQVRELLVARGIPIKGMTFSGAQVVEIGAATVLPKTGSLKTVSSATDAQSMPLELSKREVELRVQLAIERSLQSITNNRWRVEVLLNEKQALEISSLGDELLVRGKPQPRSGKMRFVLSASGKNKSELAVMATVTEIRSVVVVKQRIERGHLIRAANVEIREQEGNLPKGSIADLQLVIGKEALQTLRPEKIVQQNQIRAALQVRRGETVNVFVRTGGIVVRTRAVSKSNGALGELIILETLADKKRIDASVSGPGEATVYATGGRATDYASLNRDDRRRR